MPAEAKLKGVGVQHLAQYLRKNHGDAAMDALIAELSPDSAKMMRDPVAFEWYPLKQVVEVEQKAVARFYGGDVTASERFGRYSLERSIHQVYMVLFRLLQPTFLIKRSAAAWSTFLDQGRLEVEQKGSNAATLKVSGLDPIHDVYCNDLRGAFLAALEACGTKPEIVHTACVLKGDPAMLFEAKW